MSYLVKPTWIGFDGTPITGTIPPRLRLMSGDMTPTLASEVAHRYRLFHLNKQASRAEYLVSDVVLPDGSRMRIVANGAQEDVLVWSVQSDPRNTAMPPIAYPILIDLAFAPIYDRPVINWTFIPEEYPEEPVFGVPYPVKAYSGVAISAKLMSASLLRDGTYNSAIFETNVVVTISGAAQSPITGTASYANDGTVTLVSAPIAPSWASYSTIDMITVMTQPYLDGGEWVTLPASVRSDYVTSSSPGITPTGSPQPAIRWRPPTYQLEYVRNPTTGEPNRPPQDGETYPQPPWVSTWMDPLGQTGALNTTFTSEIGGFGTLISGSITGGTPGSFVSSVYDLTFDSSIPAQVAAAQLVDQQNWEAAVVVHQAQLQLWLSTTYQAWLDECDAVDERNAQKLGFDVLKPFRMSGRTTQIAAMNQWLEKGLGDMHLNREILAFPYDVTKMHDPEVSTIDLSHGEIIEGPRIEVDSSLAYSTWTLVDVTTETEPPGGGGF